MPSARIYHFPRLPRRRSMPSVPPRYDGRRCPRPGAAGFGLMLFVTLLGAFLYLSGAMNVARHDTPYAALLVAVWCIYFAYEPLLRTRGFGPFLELAGRVLLAGVLAFFFGFIYWLILAHG